MSDSFATLLTEACQAPLSVGFSRQRYWSAISSYRGSSWLTDRISISCVFCTAGGFFTYWVMGEALLQVIVFKPFSFYTWKTAHMGQMTVHLLKFWVLIFPYSEYLIWFYLNIMIFFQRFIFFITVCPNMMWLEQLLILILFFYLYRKLRGERLLQLYLLLTSSQIWF